MAIMHGENDYFQVFECRFSFVFLSNGKHIIDNRHKSTNNCRNQPPGVGSMNVTHLKSSSPRILWEWSVKHLGEYMNKVHFKCIPDPHVENTQKQSPSIKHDEICGLRQKTWEMESVLTKEAKQGMTVNFEAKKETEWRRLWHLSLWKRNWIQLALYLNCKYNPSTAGLNTRRMLIGGAEGALYGRLCLIPHTNPPSVSICPFAHFHLIGPGLSVTLICITKSLL